MTTTMIKPTIKVTFYLFKTGGGYKVLPRAPKTKDNPAFYLSWDGTACNHRLNQFPKHDAHAPVFKTLGEAQAYVNNLAGRIRAYYET